MEKIAFQTESIFDGADDKRTDPKFNHKIGFIPFAYHLIPLKGLAKVASVMRKGERKDRNGWEEVSVEEHINHAISHLISYLAHRHNDHHLANAGCRVLMALDLDRGEIFPCPDIGSPPAIPSVSLSSSKIACSTQSPRKQGHTWVEE